MSDVQNPTEEEIKSLTPIQLKEIRLGIKTKSEGLKEMTADEIEAQGGCFKLNGGGFAFTLPKPMFVTSIDVLGKKGIASAPQIKVGIKKNEAQNEFQLITEINSDDEDETTSANISRIITSIHIDDGTAAFIPCDKIRAVIVEGWYPEDFDKVENFLSQANTLKERLQTHFDNDKKTFIIEKENHTKSLEKEKKEIETAKQNLQQNTTETEARLTKLNVSIKTQQELIPKLQKEVEEKQIILEDLSTDQKNIQIELEGKTQSLNEANNRLDSLKEKILEKESETTAKTLELNSLSIELRKLQGDKSLFTDDMIGFAQQGSSQVKLYTFYIIIPVIIASLILAIIGIYNSIELFHAYVNNPEKINIWNLLLAKLPLLIVLTTSIGFFSYRVVKIFTARIIEIHARRLRLSEITMLSKKYVEDVADETKLDNATRADLILKNRIMLIREYLSGAFDTHLNVEKKTTPLDAFAQLLALIASASNTSSEKSLAVKKEPLKEEMPAPA